MAVSRELRRIRIHLLATEEGGRRAPIRSGYRTAFWLGRRDGPMLRDAAVTLLNQETLAPGDSTVAELAAVDEEAWEEIVDGQLLPFYEGSRMVGSVVADPGLTETAEVRDSIAGLDSMTFEDLAVTLVCSLERPRARSLSLDGGSDLVLYHDEGVSIYQFKSAQRARGREHSLPSHLLEGSDYLEYCLLTQLDPTPADIALTRSLAAQSSTALYLLTSDWLAANLIEFPRVRNFYLGDARNKLRTLLWRLDEGPPETPWRLLKSLNELDPFRKWSVTSGEDFRDWRPMFTHNDRYPGATMDAARQLGI